MTDERIVLPAPLLTGHTDAKNPLRVQLSWSEVSGADEYVLERTPGPLGAAGFGEVYRGPGQVYDDAPATTTNRTSWRYRVRAGASGEAGRWSEPAEVFTGF